MRAFCRCVRDAHTTALVRVAPRECVEVMYKWYVICNVATVCVCPRENRSEFARARARTHIFVLDPERP